MGLPPLLEAAPAIPFHAFAAMGAWRWGGHAQGDFQRLSSGRF